jgi:hypothetical protein
LTHFRLFNLLGQLGQTIVLTVMEAFSTGSNVKTDSDRAELKKIVKLTQSKADAADEDTAEVKRRSR